MENASKALIIAGAVLIGIVLITMGILFAANLRKTAKTYYTSMDASEAQKFNAEITKDFITESGETYITAQGIITLKNLLKTEKYKGFVDCETSGISKKIYEDFESNSLSEHGTNIVRTSSGAISVKKYKITVSYSNSGLINKIKIED